MKEIVDTTPENSDKVASEKINQDSKNEEQSPSNTKEVENEEEAQADWEDFEAITKGDFKRLLGCG